MSLGENYKYNGSPLNRIFSSTIVNSPDNKYIEQYKHNGTRIGQFATGNGTWNIQSDISMSILGVSISSNTVAYYVVFLTTADIIVPTGCVKMKIILIGAGGSGGAGGGDADGRKGTNGAGGGSGAIWLGTIRYNSTHTYRIIVGTGGDGVSGAKIGNAGKDGNAGGTTTLYINNLITDNYANGGGGGGGGFSNNPASSGVAGVVNNVGADFASAGYAAGEVQLNPMDGAQPAYSDRLGNFLTYPQLFTYNHGKGGNGTPGMGAPNTTITGAGANGYARVYFIF